MLERSLLMFDKTSRGVKISTLESSSSQAKSLFALHLESSLSNILSLLHTYGVGKGAQRVVFISAIGT